MRASNLVAAVLGGLLCVGCGESALPTRPSDAQTGSPLAGPGSGPLGAQHSQSVPFTGSLEGTQTVTPLQPPFIFVDGRATGTATHLGRFTVTFPHTVNFAQARGTGTYTFTAANGDTLTADFTGVAQVGTITSIVEEAVITGGTGRFAGSNGRFTATRIFNPATGITEGTFDGTISSPGAGNP
jgi:hypothetical protein